MKLSGFSLALAILTNGASLSTAFVAPIASNNNVAFHVGNKRSTGLFGIMDEVNSDAFNLLGNVADEDPKSNAMTEAYETFLAQLVFSTNDPRLDIVDNSEKSMDEGFMGFMEDKINSSTDVEEKMALNDLLDMIKDLKQRIELSEQQALREEQEKAEQEQKRLEEAERLAAEGRAMTDADVLRKAAAVDNADIMKEMGDVQTESGVAAEAPKKRFIDSELSPEIRMSYETFLKKLLPPYQAPQTVETVVRANYNEFDAQLVKVLTERANNGDSDSQVVLDALAVEQQNQVLIATEKLKKVLSAGDPMRMEGVIVKMAKEGEIDEPFLLLLEANADQARAAGATGPADLMNKLRERAITEKDKDVASKEVKLLRQLLRAPNKEEREKLLEDAFTPRETFLVRSIKMKNFLFSSNLVVLNFSFSAFNYVI